MRDFKWRTQGSQKQQMSDMLSSRRDLTFETRSLGPPTPGSIHSFCTELWRYTLPQAGQMAILVGWAMVVAILNDERVLGAGIALDFSMLTTLRTVLAFVIVFRTNQSYNRWWEGRKLWGRMHGSCVELAEMSATWIEDRDLGQRITNFASAYAYVVKQYLREQQLNVNDLPGILDTAEVESINALPPTVRPYYCTAVIRQCAKRGLTKNPQSFGMQAVARGIDMPVAQLSTQFADLVRIRNTPPPANFRLYLEVFTVVYLSLLPIVTYDTIGNWVILEVFLTSYLMLGLQKSSTYLENPFGYDPTDLELDLYVANIANHCRGAFKFMTGKGADLTSFNPFPMDDSQDKRGQIEEAQRVVHAGRIA